MGLVRDKNESKIIESAVRVFALGGGTVKEIAKGAEVPKANVHYYFKSKQALYDAAIDYAKEHCQIHICAAMLAKHCISKGDLIEARSWLNQHIQSDLIEA